MGLEDKNKTFHRTLRHLPLYQQKRNAGLRTQACEPAIQRLWLSIHGTRPSIPIKLKTRCKVISGRIH